LHLLEAERLCHARPEHRDQGTAGAQVLDELLDGLELRGTGEVRAESHPLARIRLDDRDVEARRS
jgi:hypothetical protein